MELPRPEAVVARPESEPAPALALAELLDADWPWTAPWMAERMSPKSPCWASVWMVWPRPCTAVRTEETCWTMAGTGTWSVDEVVGATDVMGGPRGVAGGRARPCPAPAPLRCSGP